jgi:hypothetical protein
MTVIRLDERRFDPWLVSFDRAVTAVLSTDRRPDDPPAKARRLVTV